MPYGPKITVRSYFKIYQKGRVYYAHAGEVPNDNQATIIWAVKVPKKTDFVAMLNYNNNNYVAYTYLGPDPVQGHGVSLNTISFGSFITFEDYSLHPKN